MTHSAGDVITVRSIDPTKFLKIIQDNCKPNDGEGNRTLIEHNYNMWVKINTAHARINTRDDMFLDGDNKCVFNVKILEGPMNGEWIWVDESGIVGSNNKNQLKLVVNV